MKTNCHICSSNNWLPLPDPVDLKSVTTTGRIVPEPLAKSICLECGLVQRARAPFLGSTSYYEEEYANYYERPGTEQFHKKRYEKLVEWMSPYLTPDFTFSTVLDVGCGQGWAMDAMASKYPGINIHGIEPSKHNSSVARKRGHILLEGKLENLNIKKKYDLIYSNNVFQHVNDPVAFLKNIRQLANDNTVIMITCPNGAIPNIELLFSDHNYSFLPDNLISIGKSLAFDTVLWDGSSENPSLPPAQLLLLTNNSLYSQSPTKFSEATEPDLDSLSALKIEYIKMVEPLKEHLLTNIQRSRHVYNFGASFWTSILAAYCPDYWGKVEACVVDNKDDSNEFMGKPIAALNEISDREDAVIVLGTSPATHDILRQKLVGRKIVGWDTFFKY